MSISFKKMTRVVSWLMTFGVAFAFSVPTAQAIEFFPTPGRYQWVSQSGTLSTDGTAHEVRVNAGDTVQLSLTIKNRTIDPRAQIWYGVPPGGTLLPEVAPYRGAHELRVGVKNDEILTWIDSSSFLANPDGDDNRFAVYNGADARPGDSLTFTWNLKIKAGTADGTYNLYTMVVREFDSRFRQVDAAGRLIASDDVFWRVIVGQGTTTPTTSGALTVSLSSQTPVAASVATGGNANFTRITLTAAAGTTVKVSQIFVTRDGLSADSDVENVKLLTAEGVQVGGTAGGFNANHQAQIYINPALALTGSQDYYIRAGLISTASAGRTARLGIAANSDLVSDATSTGGAPVYGNFMTVVNVTIGSVTVAEDGSVSDDTPDVGETDIITNTFKITAGSTESITIERITVMKAGSSETADSNNIELWDVTHGATLGTTVGWTADGKASWPVNLALGKGDTIRLRVQLDIVDGVGLTVNTDIADGSDYLVFAKGDIYGFYITPTASSASNWSVQSAGSNNLGQGDYNQTINSGSLTITKSAASPGTSTVTVADNQVLTIWDFDVRGESMRISATNVDIEANGTWGSGETFADLTNGRLYAVATGNVLAGPVDGATDTDGGSDAADDGTFAFTNTFVLAPGVTQVGFKVRIGVDFDGAETLAATIGDATDVTAKGLITNNSISPSGLEAAGNTQTIKAGAATLATLGNPSAKNVVVGIKGYTWSTFSIDATQSGEDVLVSSLTVTDTLADTADMADIDAAQLWADKDYNGSWETLVTNTEYPTGGGGTSDTHTFTLKETLRVTKGKAMGLAFIGDLLTSAYTNAGEDHTITLTSGTITGADTGSDIGEGTSGAAGAQTITEVGTVTVSLDSSSPDSVLMIAGTTNVIGAWKLYAADEAFRVEKLAFEFINSAGSDATDGSDSVKNITLTYPKKDGSTGTVTKALSLDDQDAFVFDGLDMWIVQDSYATVTLSVDFYKINYAGEPADFQEYIAVTLEADDETNDYFTAIGQSSGTEDDDCGADTANNGMILYKTILTVSKNTTGLSTVLTAGTLDLYQWTVTADTIANGMTTGGGAAIKKFLFTVTISDADAGDTLGLDQFTILRNGSQVTNVDIAEIAFAGTYTSNVEDSETNGEENVGEGASNVQVAFISETTTETGEQTVAAGATVTYLLRAVTGALSAYESNDTIAVVLENDVALPASQTTAYLSDDDATNNEYIVALQNSSGTQDTADVEFIWSDISGSNHTSGFDDDGVAETSQPDWTNGYLVKNFPLATFVLTAA